MTGRPPDLPPVDYAALFNASPTAYLVLDRDLVIMDANPAYLAMVDRDRAGIVGRPVFDVFPPQPDAMDGHGDHPIQTSFRLARDTGRPDVMPMQQFDLENPVSGKMEERYWSLISAPVVGTDGSVQYVLQRVEDVTDYVRDQQGRVGPVGPDQSDGPDGEKGRRARSVEAELYARMQELQIARQSERAAVAALTRSEERARAVLETALDAILMIDSHGVIESMNPAAERMFGISVAEVAGRPVSLLMPSPTREDIHPDLDEYYRSGTWDVTSGDLEMLGRRSDGVTFPIELAVSPVGRGTGLFTCVLRDISERKRFEHELAQQALHDPLTGLANRALLLDRLNHAVVRLSRHPGVLALLFIDLDRFKQVNDRWGHEAGDELLKETARRLVAAVRTEDLVARFGGDEFVVVCEELDQAAAAETIASRVAAALRVPVVIGGETIPTSASVGVVCDEGRRTALELLRAADTDMYRSKKRQSQRRRPDIPDPRRADAETDEGAESTRTASRRTTATSDPVLESSQ